MKQPTKQQTEVEKLKEEIQRLQNEKEEYKTKYLRALADYQNYEKRSTEARTVSEKNACKHLLLKLLPFLDHLEKAELFVKDEGLKLIKNQFDQTLRDTGLKEIEVIGKPYDPYTAEVVEVVQGNTDNVVTEVVRKGYMYGDEIIRVAQVKVSKKL